MFDRFGVGSPSPFGVRGGILVIGVHAAILGYGLRGARHQVAPEPVVERPMIYLPQQDRPGLPGSVPAVPAPGLIDVRVPDLPVPTVQLPGRTTVPEPTPILAAPIGVPGDPNGVYDSNVVEQLPELLSSAPPRYPDLLRQAHIEGVVVVQGVVDTLGHFERSSLRVISSPHPALAASAVECLSSAVFRPGRVEGRAVRVLVQVPVQFTISRR